MKNFEVARQFEHMADILELKGENPFRIRSYRGAAQNLQSLSEDIEAVAREERLEDIPGIGADLAGKIQEYLQTGKIKGIAAASKGIRSRRPGALSGRGTCAISRCSRSTAGSSGFSPITTSGS